MCVCGNYLSHTGQLHSWIIPVKRLDGVRDNEMEGRWRERERERETERETERESERESKEGVREEEEN